MLSVPQDWLAIVDKDALEAAERRVDELTPDARCLCPRKEQWLRALHLTPLDNVKVIIIGQDPYYTTTPLGTTANGLAFGCTEKKVPPSLRNIYECLYRQGLVARVPNHGQIEPWARRGVLLLNAALSTELGKPNAHAAVWFDFVSGLIRSLSAYGKQKGRKYSWLLWGRFAQQFEALIDPGSHHVLKWAHPSPMAQARLPDAAKFVRCDHFRICAAVHGISWELGSYEPQLSGVEP